MISKGEVYGELTALEKVEGVNKSKGYYYTRWLFKCSCGKYKEIDVYLVQRTTRPSRSCGCLNTTEKKRKYKTKSIKHYRQLKTVWHGMMSRCYSDKSVSYKNYGQRGIKVCSSWHDFTNFYNDMIDSYSPGLSLDRRENNKDYTPKNCKWATRIEQSNNRRTNVIVEGMPAKKWCQENKVSYSQFMHYRHRGSMNVDEILNMVK